ncbi:MAG: molybdopterin-dependent oxidoreductase [Actinomycetia bacterium]|nr:molybdopterin-dependent oxidoreductase [Actinomycetes bacterium]
MSTKHIRTCPLCEATCGLELTIDDDGSVKVIRGDRDDVFSAGFICPKGTTLAKLNSDPDRLRKPLVRRELPDGGTELIETTWEEAFAAVDAGLAAVREAHGNDSVAVYLGNPSAHGHAGPIFARTMIKALSTRNVYSASTVDQMPKHVSSGLMFGHGLTIPVPDLDRTDHLLMLGANPYESNGSLCTAPDFPGRLEAIIERGGKVVVVDPRRTKTAEHASEHVRIRPGTDALLLVAIAHVLVSEDLAEPGHAGEHADGLGELGRVLDRFTPESVSQATGITAHRIRNMARELAAAPTAAVYGRIGVHTVEFGTLAAWATDVVNLLTGNLDSPGGAMWPSPAHLPARDAPGGRGYRTGRWSSRVGDHPEANGELPVSILAEEILTPGDGQVRALLTVSGNPALSTPESERLSEALDSVEFMVSVDPALNETTRHADVVLPPPGPLERSHYDLAFYSLSVRNIANWSPPLYEPEGPEEAEILTRLTMIAMGLGADADPQAGYDLALDTLLTQAVGREGSPVEGREVEELRAMVGGDRPADQVLDVMLRLGQHGDGFGADPEGLSLEKLADNPHGVDLGPLVPQLPNILATSSGRIETLPDIVVADLDRLAAAMQKDWPDLVLVGRRDLRSNNSWMHNVEVLVKGKPRCTLHVHPVDAERYGLSEGADAVVTSRVGSVQVPVEVTDEVMQGVVSLPHGWGHDQPGTRMKVASRVPGVNSNVLTDPERIDPLSGNASLNAIPVTLDAATT